jgi:hypothetical protein
MTSPKWRGLMSGSLNQQHVLHFTSILGHNDWYPFVLPPGKAAITLPPSANEMIQNFLNRRRLPLQVIGSLFAPRLTPNLLEHLFGVDVGAMPG